MIDNGKNSISVGGGITTLLRNGSRGSSLVLHYRGGKGLVNGRNRRYITGECPLEA